MPKSRSPRFLLLTTVGSLLALITALSGIVYLVYRDWMEGQRDSLIQEVLWLDQSLRLHLETHREWAENAANDVSGLRINGYQFQQSARLLLRENPELLEAERVDARGRILWDTRRVNLPGDVLSGAAHDALWRASKLMRAAYGEAYRGRDGKYRFDMAVPIIVEGEYVGGIRLVYQMEGLLYNQVPWWIASKYLISIQDLGGKVLASRFDEAEQPGTLQYQISFDPPGHGLTLRAVEYRSAMGLTLPVLVVAVVTLVLALLYSVWRIRRHIRERSAAERALELEMSLRQAMEDSMKSGLMALSASGEIVRVNRAFCAMSGFSENELVGQSPPHSFWPTNEYPLLHDTIAAVLRGFQPEHGFEVPFVTKNGEAFEVRLFATPLVERDGSQRGWICSMYDITELKKKRLALNASHQRFLTVLNGLDAGVCVTDKGGSQLLYANPTFSHLWMKDEPDADCCLLLPRLPDGDEEGAENQHLEFTSDGGSNWFQIHRRRIEWVDGQEAWLSILTDVTELRQREARERAQEERFQNTSRLIAMGEMASSLAHELNQPLSAINTYSSGLQRRLPPDLELPKGVREAIQAISEQARRAGQIVNSIRAFVKKHAPQLELADPAKVVGRAIGLAEPMVVKHGVNLLLQPSESVCRLEMDPVLIEQVLLNLIKNAVEAMRDAETRRPQVTVRYGADAGYWRVEVADNGPGLSDSIRSNLFTPFYSSKPDGLGIGLNICRSIVEFHRGQFGVERSAGGGCAFWFTLPVAALEREQKTAPAGAVR
ncbi:multi-sensor signal transduction histidine kinase [Pseudogulbenkiania sp. NH8B]|uniref:PAS domain S-box protein n=1 Tax=Pseudogulbenkiania sp. (strain NH8B) TaxID=748280 RepID=UPI0002279F34|nr:PAS domain S-box protein [Pseudogulbenkiania sp. NH8B]BAK77831.1 multi-sensor signal transduction histidine kinase [Pseudogulbenkiania sp. NH8B]